MIPNNLSRDSLIIDSMLRAGVPRSMARPDFSMKAEFNAPGEYLASWGRRASTFFSEGRVLLLGAERSSDILIVGRMLYGLARSLILNRNSCRVVPLPTILQLLSGRESDASMLAELEDMDALLLPDFYAKGKQPPFSQDAMSKLEGWMFHQLTRKGQSFILVCETTNIDQCSAWWNRWLLAAIRERLSSFILAGEEFDIR